ncbi:hypothetical protein CgunFtcFv8_023713 [Champsocephalus gunnari]|uniref:Uncharacterized protein n=1 Tax=Champsocephalus gunnari TaxID=52237 RepID=A0AAN8DCW7_CHAGU|nr:hypothetical protein CgunFtcFv8_023713 [Champsocephalus gunnari]
MCLKCAGEDPKTALFEKKLPEGLKALQSHPSRQRSDPNADLSPGPGSTFQLRSGCRVLARLSNPNFTVGGGGLNALHYVIDDMS